MARSAIDYTILVAAVVGVLLAGYAVTLHYSPSASSFCSFSAAWNCDKVNHSPWSVFLGIPVAILGLLAYLTLLLLMLKRTAIKRLLDFTDKDFYGYLLVFALVMFGFQAYLTYIEAFYIHSFCVVCIASQVCTIVVAIAVGWRALLSR